MEIDNETGQPVPLPDTMYSRDVAIRLLRHAAWYCMALRLPIARECVETFALAQKQVLEMSLSDFYRIKIMGTVAYIPNVTLCTICHRNFVDTEAGFDTCDDCMRRQ